MADSRFAAYRYFIKKSWPFGLKATLFLLIVIMGLAVGHFLTPDNWEPEKKYALSLVLIAALLWFTEAIPPFAVALLIIGTGVLALGSSRLAEHPVLYTKFTETLASSIIWLLLGGFFLAKGMQKAGLDLEVFRTSVKLFGKKPETALLGMMLTTWLASSVMSNTAATAMMLAAVLPMIRQIGPTAPMSQATLLGIPAAATLGGMATIIGSPPNAVAVGFLERSGVEVSFPAWMLYGTFPALLLCILAWLVLISVHKPKVKEVHIHIPSREEVHIDISRFQQNLVALGLLGTLGLWLTTPLHGLPVAATAFIPIVLFTVSGVINSDDFNAMPWDTLILVAGGLSLGVAMTETGLVNEIAQAVQSISIAPILMLIALCFLTVLLSNFMSNTAAATVVMPLALEILPDQALMVGMGIGMSASFALMLPVSTPPNAIAFGTGYLEQKAFRTLGLAIGVAGPIVALVWLYFWT